MKLRTIVMIAPAIILLAIVCWYDMHRKAVRLEKIHRILESIAVGDSLETVRAKVAELPQYHPPLIGNSQNGEQSGWLLYVPGEHYGLSLQVVNDRVTEYHFTEPDHWDSLLLERHGSASASAPMTTDIPTNAATSATAASPATAALTTQPSQVSHSGTSSTSTAP